MRIREAQSIHCIGIGGIGLSALARWLMALGIQVTGSDLQSSIVVDQLRGLGADIQVGPEAGFLPDRTDLVLVSPAIPKDDPGQLAARRQGIVEMSYPEALAQLSQSYQSIAVAGTHGKTTTTAMLGSILEQAGLDPIVVVGSLIPAWSGNFRLGQGKLCVYEADEYNRSFLAYHPDMAVITNVDRDHLDTYQDIDDILKAFQTFIQQATPNGQLVLNDDDEPSKRLQVPSNLKKTSFSLQRVSGVTPTTDRPGIRFTAPGLGEVRLNVPGRHMVANALAAMTAAQALGVEPEAIRRGLEAYTGAWRRFEHLGDLHGAPVISDYAHHPTEVLATIRAAREAFPDKRLLVLFQPHQKRRLRQLEDEFSKALADVSYLLLTEVYEVSGREDRSGDAISSRHLAGLLRGPGKTILFLPTVQEALDVVAGVLTPGDVLLCLGAGDIHATLTAFLKEAR